MTETAGLIEQWRGCYGAGDACVPELLCDRHPARRAAFTIVDEQARGTEVSYGQLRDRSERFAAALAAFGVVRGARVATLMGKSADLPTALLGIWRLGAVHVPLFTAFAPSAIATRLEASGADVVVADASQVSKLDGLLDGRTLVVAGGEDERSMQALVAQHEAGRQAVAVGGDAPFVELFTSGTTGAPKGVPIPVRAIASFVAYQHYGLDVAEDDVFWNAADPGWAYGLYYGVITPMATARCSLLLASGFSPELTLRVLREHGVTNFAAAPTVYRALRAQLSEPVSGLALRHCSSAGEPLNPDVVTWAERVLGVAVRDHYGQTELGMVVVNGWHPDVRVPVRPGSMGCSIPGHAAAVLRDDADQPAQAGTQGRVAIDRSASPLMWFTGYRDAPGKTAERFSADGRWYYTGDAGSVDAEGHFFFSSRDDDVIIMAGYRIGPFEVESALASHAAVMESAVVGVPDELRGEVVEAFVVLREGVEAGEGLTEELQQHVKRGFAAHAYPRAIHYVAELPKTPSGKIQRFLLRER